MHVDEVVNIKNKDIAAHLKLPPVKLHCRYDAACTPAELK